MKCILFNGFYEAKESEITSDVFEDNYSKPVRLTEEQIKFKEDNPTATPKQVFYMDMTITENTEEEV